MLHSSLSHCKIQVINAIKQKKMFENIFFIIIYTLFSIRTIFLVLKVVNHPANSGGL